MINSYRRTGFDTMGECFRAAGVIPMLKIRRSVIVGTTSTGHGDAILLDCSCPNRTAAVSETLGSPRAPHAAAQKLLVWVSVSMHNDVSEWDNFESSQEYGLRF